VALSMYYPTRDRIRKDSRMHDDRNDSGPAGMQPDSNGERDALGALISAAGRRPAPPKDAYDEVFAAAHGAWQSNLRTRAQRRWAYALAATVAMLAVGVGLIVQLVPQTTGPVVATTGIVQGEVLVQRPGDDNWELLRSMTDPIVAGTRLRTTVNGRLALTLPSDASLRLDADTIVTVATAQHLELATGTIFIDAGTESVAEQFTVTTRFGTVRDIGTQFEVATLDDSLRVRVREGEVEITAQTTVGPVRSFAGEEISLAANGRVERTPFSPFDPGWGWIETLAGTPDVEGQSLLLFLSWVARETGRELQFDAPVTETRARTVILHGSAARLSPLEALEVMLSTTDFDYTLRNDGVILISPRASSQ